LGDQRSWKYGVHGYVSYKLGGVVVCSKLRVPRVMLTPQHLREQSLFARYLIRMANPVPKRPARVSQKLALNSLYH